MTSATKAVIASLALLFGASDFHVADWRVGMGFLNLVFDAEARVRRPATPGSVAGVPRRTTRRVIRRGAYVGASPPAVRMAATTATASTIAAASITRDLAAATSLSTSEQRCLKYCQGAGAYWAGARDGERRRGAGGLISGRDTRVQDSFYEQRGWT